MRVNTWNTATGRGSKAHTGGMDDPEPSPKSIHVGENGACFILEAPDGKSFRVTFTPDELGQLFAARHAT